MNYIIFSVSMTDIILTTNMNNFYDVLLVQTIKNIHDVLLVTEVTLGKVVISD